MLTQNCGVSKQLCFAAKAKLTRHECRVSRVRHTQGPGVQDPSKGDCLFSILHQLTFPVIPNLQQLMTGGCTNQSWVNQPWEPHPCRPIAHVMMICCLKLEFAIEPKVTRGLVSFDRKFTICIGRVQPLAAGKLQKVPADASDCQQTDMGTAHFLVQALYFKTSTQSMRSGTSRLEVCSYTCSCLPEAPLLTASRTLGVAAEQVKLICSYRVRGVRSSRCLQSPKWPCRLQGSGLSRSLLRSHGQRSQ